MYIREDILLKLLKMTYIYNHTECLTIKINLRKTKWLFICSYNALNSNLDYHLDSVGEILDHNSAQYNRILLEFFISWNTKENLQELDNNQWNFCTSLFRKSKTSYIQDPNRKVVRDNIKFWKKVFHIKWSRKKNYSSWKQWNHVWGC